MAEAKGNYGTLRKLWEGLRITGPKISTQSHQEVFLGRLPYLSHFSLPYIHFSKEEERWKRNTSLAVSILRVVLQRRKKSCKLTKCRLIFGRLRS
jgi:hypothetical protein